MDLQRFLAIARADEPADLVLRNGRVVDVFTGEVLETDVALAGGRIAGLGPGYAGREEADLAGRFVAPGLIDAHVHVESAMVPPREFARAVVPRGVTTVVADPHEIANVCGLDGIRFMLRDAAGAPLEMFINAPSCVPATALETSGAALEAADLAALLAEPRLLGLAEMMDFPGVVAGAAPVLAKLAAFAGRPLDGHCPGLRGAALNAYVAAGIGSDHECTSAEEAREKLRLGMTVVVREATNARNLRALLPVLTHWSERRLCFCTDDRQTADLVDEGTIDHMVRLAIAEGVEPATAFRLASLNAAEHYGLKDRGAIAPGRRADLVVFADLRDFRAEEVFIGGRRVAAGGRALFTPGPPTPASPRDTVRIAEESLRFEVPASGRTLRVIGIVPDQLVTESLALPARIEAGLAVADPERDLAKIAVVERHRASARVGKGFVRGFGLRRGALAGSVAHDHHNLVAVGVDDTSLGTAVRAVAGAGGGLAAALGEEVLALLPLPIAGLMSDRSIEEVRAGMRRLLEEARRLGSTLHDPFMAMSFLGLEVIPALKITDFGLIDVERLAPVPLFVDGGARPHCGESR